MKLSAVAITGFLMLNIIAVAFTASVRSYVVSDSEPIDWKQHVPKADKRSMKCTGCASMDHSAEVTAEKRTMECTGCANMDDNDEVQPAQKLSLNPMNPYLSLKSFLPTKPTFIPPFMDPSYFINKKAELLNNLFGATNTESSDPKPSSAEAKRDTVDESINSVQPPLVPFSPFLALSPIAKPTVVPSGYWMPMSGPGIVDPATMIDKKTKFLNTLFSKIASPDSSVAARAIAPQESTLDVSTSKQSVLPADFWLQFLQTLPTPEPPTVKSTIVPPEFWIPSSISKTSAKPFSPKVPMVDPSEFIDKKTAFLNTLFKTLNITITPVTETTAESTSDPKPANLQKVVSPTVKPSIVPPGYWMPMSGPGIVDPATMIDKKTTFLNTLFSKIASPDSSVAARAIAPQDLTSSASSAKQSVLPPDFWLQFLPSLITPEPPTVKSTIVPPEFWIPSSISKTPAKPFSPKVPMIDPSEFIDKKTAFLNTLFKTLNITSTPVTETTAESTSDPKPANLQKVVSPTVKSSIVPPGYWMPMSGPGIVDPATMIDKKTTFLNTLFSKIASPDSSVAARAVVPEDLTSSASSTKQSTVPPDFWLQFLPSFTTPEPPTVKPTIVPPGFWIPSYVSKTSAKPFSPKIPSVDPSEFIDKKNAFLNTLFKTLNITITPSSAVSPKPTPDPIADLLYQLLSLAVNNGTQQSTLKRSITERGENEKPDNYNSPSEEQETANNIPTVINQPANLSKKRSTITEDISVQNPMPVDALLDAKDRLTNTIMTALSGIKNNILDTVTELLAQQKEAATVSASTASKKKPGPLFGPWGTALLKTVPKPTPDPTLFQNKVEFLSQIFDAVTKLDKDITGTLNEAINESFSQSTDSPTVTSETRMGQITNAADLLQFIKSELSDLANDSSYEQAPKFSRATFPKGFSTGLPTPKPTIVEPSFWIPKVNPETAVDPTFYLSKTQDFLNKLFASKAAGTSADNSESTTSDKVRSIKMAVHQGYQSLPPGTEELLQAGGGSNSMDHEGGGLKLQDDVFPLPVIPNNGGGHHHHHNK